MKKIECEEVRKIRDIPQGSFVRMVGKNGHAQQVVYIRGEYDRSTRKYELQAFDDINKFRYVKGDSVALVGFTF